MSRKSGARGMGVKNKSKHTRIIKTLSGQGRRNTERKKGRKKKRRTVSEKTDDAREGAASLYLLSNQAIPGPKMVDADVSNRPVR